MGKVVGFCHRNALPKIGVSGLGLRARVFGFRALWVVMSSGFHSAAGRSRKLLVGSGLAVAVGVVALGCPSCVTRRVFDECSD